MRLSIEQRRRSTETSGRTADSPVRRGRGSTLELQRTAGNQAVQALLRPLSAHRPTSVPGAIGAALKSAPSPLDHATRAFFETRFGHDFSDVRIHTSPEAAASARLLQANAWTCGSDIVFREGAWAPATDQGRRLLAHELAHVVQQSRSGTPAIQRQAQNQSQTGSQGQAHGGGVQVAVNTNCGEADARAIALSIARAEGMLNAALDWFRNPDPVNDVQVNALLQVHFGSDSAATRRAVHSRLTTVAAILGEASRANVNLNCTGAGDTTCSKNEYYAYVRQGQGYRINFCRDFFNMNPAEQVWGIIHETCHLAGALGDDYNFMADADSAECFTSAVVKGSPLGNADSYVTFVWCLVKPGSKIREGINITGHHP